MQGDETQNVNGGDTRETRFELSVTVDNVPVPPDRPLPGTIAASSQLTAVYCLE